MSLARRLKHTWFLGKLSKTFLGSFQLHVPFSGRHQDSLHAGMVLGAQPLVYDQLLRWHTQRTCLCSQTARNRLCAMALVALVEIQAPMEVEGLQARGCNTGALIPTLPPSSSSAFGANSLPCASSNKLPYCFGFHHSTGGANKYLYSIQPSVPSTFLAQIVNPKGPDDGHMVAEASITLAHRTVPREERRASLHSFRKLSCRLHQPKTGGMRHKPSQQIVVCWHLNSRC